MKLRKRVTTGILAAALVISSLQFSTVTVRAEEISQEIADEVSDIEDTNSEKETVSQDTNEGEKENSENSESDIEDEETEENSENSESDVENEETEENSENSESDAEDEETENSASLIKIQETSQLEMADAEMEGVYQFGDSPSKERETSSSGMTSMDADDTGTTSTDSIEEYLYQQMLMRNTTIDIQNYNISVSSLKSLFSGILNEHPDLYFVERSYSYSYAGTTVYSLKLTYDDTLDDTAFQKAKETALSVVNQEMSELEKAIALHDYLVVNCEYDKENLDANTIPDTSYSAYGVLVNRIAVCNGYALAYKYLLNQVGIECYMVSSDTMNHAWNLIVLNGQYYQVDVTWDDPTWDLIGRACHTYMFCSDDAFSGHSDWEVTSGSSVVNYTAIDTSYDAAFWKSCKSPLVIEGDDCYYISSADWAIKKSSLSDVTNAGTTIVNIGKWTVWGNDYSYWSGTYSGLFLASNRLYYNDKTAIYSIALDGTEKCTEFTADTTDGYIYGSAYCQGKVLYSIHQTPNMTEKETVLTADIKIGSGESATIPVESIELSEESLALTTCETATLVATVYPENATNSTVTWTSSNDAVAEVENGVVKAVAAGKCNITAAADGKEAVCSVTVTAGDIAKGTVDESYGQITWVIDKEGKLSVTGTGDFSDVTTADRAPWYLYRSNIKSAEINVTGMINASYMFNGCGSLSIVDLSNLSTKDMQSVTDMFSNCGSLATIYTPCNLTLAVALPVGTGDVWYRPNGTTITQLPQNFSYSIEVTKNKVPSSIEPHITVEKIKTAFECGDTLNIDDLTVSFYSSDGTITKVTDYSTNADEIDMAVPGTKLLEITYNGLTVTVELTVSAKPIIKENVEISGITIQNSVYSGTAVSYSGNAMVKTSDNTDITDKVILDYKYSGVQADGSSYTNSDNAPVNAGKYALTVSVSEDDENYTGSVEYQFEISKASIIVAALENVIYIGESKSLPDLYKYEVKELVEGDKLITEPTFSYTDLDGNELSKDDINLTETGSYYIIPANADAGMNYTITYQKGVLVMEKRNVECTVTFDLNGCIAESLQVVSVAAGSLIDEPEVPEAEGHIFKGWYKDKACTKVWNFSTNTVQGDITLYACWVVAPVQDITGADLCIQEIQNPTYTGSALKPTVLVYSGDGETLLKAGKDYTIKYYNNINADTADEAELGGISQTGIEGDNGFTTKLAYIVITGKGNYKGTIYQNFHIDAASISAQQQEGNGTLSSGFVMKYTEQLVVNTRNALKPFASLRYKKAMKAGTDYEVVLTALNAYDAQNNVLENGSIISKNGEKNTLPVIPSGYYGTFLMTVTGTGNYTGTITKTIYVSDKNHLIKNASITLGKNQKTIKGKTREELEGGITLTPAYYDASAKKYYIVGEDGVTSEEISGNDAFTVKFGKTFLVYGQDFTIDYTNNTAVGTATMTITGIGEYAGTKNVNFKINGTAFNTKNIVVDSTSFQTSMSYVGKALTQNGVVLYPKGGSVDDALIYGRDYTISYANNLKKGTATMTFTAKTTSGYSGSFKKTFKITAAEFKDIADVTTVVSVSGENSIQYQDDGSVRFEGTVYYTKEGAKLSDRLQLINRETGTVLKEGTDYKISYKNNKAVTVGKTIADNKKPCMTITGKGNYAGTVAVYFDISEGTLTQEDISVTMMAWNTRKNYRYAPKIKIVDGKKTLSAGAKKDYVVTYENNDQENVTKYVNGEIDAKTPVAVITIPEGSSYSLVGENGEIVTEIRVPLKIYKKALKKNELYIVVENPVYTGGQLKPCGDAVKVYIGSAKAVKSATKAGERDEDILTAENGAYGLSRLTEGTDYILSYGTNVKAGKNQGSLTVIGNSKEYGGSITVKFTILSKDIYKEKHL